MARNDALVESTERSERIGWVLPPLAIRGLDHLGAQAPCVALYQQLLPGITNVTARARYFSFYPWFIWSFEQRSADRSEPAFAQAMRRADCLFTLVACRHREVMGETTLLHDVTTIGNLVLGPAAQRAGEGEELRLDEYATLEPSPRRYFQTPWGGFGQYYFGALRDLRIIDYVQGTGPQPAGYDRVRGAAIAEAFEASVDSTRFFECLNGGTVSAADLDALASFCPCGLHRSTRERELLVDAFLARTTDYVEGNGSARRESMGLLLEVAGLGADLSIEWPLRAGAYSGCLPVGKDWLVPERLARTRARWAVYHRNELLSSAIQGLFWAVLQSMHHAHRGWVRRAGDAGEILVGLAVEAGWADRLDATFASVVASARHSLPAIGAWEDAAHEHVRAQHVVDVARHFAYDPAELAPTVDHALAVLVALAARAEPGRTPYFDYEFEPDRFGGPAIDLQSFDAARTARWPQQTVRDWLRWLATTWGVERHLQVALTKLGSQRRDTFRIRPLDDRLQLVEVAPAGFTAPRVGRAQQILVDLGLLARTDGDGKILLTDAGRKELEAICG